MSSSDSEEGFPAEKIGKFVAGPAVGIVTGVLTGNPHLGQAASAAASEVARRNPEVAKAVGIGATVVGATGAAVLGGTALGVAVTICPPLTVAVALVAAGGWAIKKLTA